MVEEAVLGEALYSKGMEESLDELDETLSLCDLPLYSNNNQNVADDQWNDQDCCLSSTQESSMSSSSQHDHDDYFEFLSQDLIPSATDAVTTTTAPPNNIIFCGKLIPYKQPPSNTPANEQDHHTPKIKRSVGWIWSWGMFGRRKIKSSDSKNSTATLKHDKDHRTSKSNNSKKQGFAIHKMPILTPATSEKARWYFFLSGISRFSTKVDLRDIKNRQSRGNDRRSLELSPSSPDCQKDGKDTYGGRNRGSGVWGLIRVLSCGGNLQHPNTMIVASIRS